MGINCLKPMQVMMFEKYFFLSKYNSIIQYAFLDFSNGIWKRININALHWPSCLVLIVFLIVSNYDRSRSTQNTCFSIEKRWVCVEFVSFFYVRNIKYSSASIIVFFWTKTFAFFSQSCQNLNMDKCWIDKSYFFISPYKEMLNQFAPYKRLNQFFLV